MPQVLKEEKSDAEAAYRALVSLGNTVRVLFPPVHLLDCKEAD